MPVTVSSAVRQLLDRIEPQPRELERAETQVATISTRLLRDFQCNRIGRFGSHAKGTAVRVHSDVDVFVVFTREEIRWRNPRVSSRVVMARIQRNLAARFTMTPVRQERQAVSVRFGGGQHAVDVVPAQFGSFDAAHPRFLIPDGEDGWLETSPSAHLAWLNSNDRRSGNKLRALIRLLKWWAASRAATRHVRSTYLEWFLGAARVSVGATYQEALAQTLSLLQHHRCPPLTDPLHISVTPLAASPTKLQHHALLSALDVAVPRAIRAVEFELRGRDSQALLSWNSVYNGTFLK